MIQSQQIKLNIFFNFENTKKTILKWSEIFQRSASSIMF